MDDAPYATTWLETPEGECHVIGLNCSLGRSAGNNVVVESAKASRRHAIVHLQNLGEFWLVDLGSTNGTWHNGRRVQQPLRLCNGDEIVIGNKILKFRQPQEFSADYKTTFAAKTLRTMEHVNCWLLLADVENFTPLSQSIPVADLAVLLGDWFGACKQIVEERGGSINKYLGDGLLAYWKHTSESTRYVVQAINAAKDL